MRIWSKLGNETAGNPATYFEQVMSNTSPGEEYRPIPSKEEIHLFDFYLDESILPDGVQFSRDRTDDLYQWTINLGGKVTVDRINLANCIDINARLILYDEQGEQHTSNVLFSHLRWELKKVPKIKLLRSYRAIKKINIDTN